MEEKLCDVVFIGQGKRFPAHRNIVEAAAPVLDAMLTNGMLESGKRKIHFGEVMAQTWSTTLDFIYYQQIELIDMKQGLKVLECSRRFHVLDLKETVTDFIMVILDDNNCCEAIIVSDRLYLFN